MTANESRNVIRDKYRTILGRNSYSQPKRSYCYTKYKDGKFYSDCSSSIAATYKVCGFPITYGGNTLPNTVGMYHSKDLKEVPVKIKNGVIENPEVLRIGDMLLFAGTDKGRAKAGYVGHVEMVGEIDKASGRIVLYGHGSGTPRATQLNNYCKQRYAKKTDTKLGHRGLIKVVRRIQDDDAPSGADAPVENLSAASARVTIYGCKAAHLRTGPGTNYASVGTCKKGDAFDVPNAEGWQPVIHGGMVCWISAKFTKEEAI